MKKMKHENKKGRIQKNYIVVAFLSDDEWVFRLKTRFREKGKIIAKKRIFFILFFFSLFFFSFFFSFFYIIFW